MESQLQRQDGHNGYEEEPRHSVVEGEGESEGKGEVEGVHHHGEKKSVLTKVKDKAKKIKDAIKKHGHGHDHGHNLEEEEEDEQMMDDPQVHGSPMLDSTVIGSVNLGQRITPGQTGVNIEKPTESHEDGFNRNVRDEGVTPVGLRDNMGRTTAMETDEGRATARETAQFAFGKVADSPVMGREEANVGQTRVNIGQSVHSPSGAIPPSNYQSKVVDPTGTGGEEADVAPHVGQFDKMNVLYQTDPKSKPESESSKIRTSSYPENPESTLKRLDPEKTEDMPRDTVTGKLSYATSAIADKAATSAIADSPVVGREEANVGQTKVKIGQSVHSPSEAIPPSSYQSKVVDPKGTGGEEADVAPLVGEFDKMNVLDQTDSKSKPESESESSKIRTSSCPENPESTLKRLDPGKTEDLSRDTVSGKLSYATSAIADKAATSAIADSPVVGREEANVGQTKVNIGQSVRSPSGAIPPSNYQSRVVDPKGTGGEEADVAPLVGEFDKMKVLDQTNSKSKPESESSKIRTSSCPENPESILKRLDPGKTEDMPRDTVTGKLSYATSAIADTAVISAIADSPVVGREEANMGQTKVKIGQSVHSPSEAIPPSNYQSKVVDPKGTGGEEAEVAPLVGDFDKMNVLDQTDSKSKSESESSKIRTSSCPENPESTLKRLDPGKTEDMPCDNVTGKLSYATSAIADKAISAKNATASKLGYGGHEEGQDSQKATSESAQSVAATMTEKSALVYHKVVDASSAVMSKVQGSGTLDEGRDRATLVGNEGKGTDKGFSVKDYLAEKFRPGDEDKALSEAMSGALHNKKGETGKPVGEVTESEQMARGLGTGSENKREGEDVLSAGNESKGAGMVDRIKDAVGSWLGGSSGMQTSQDSLAQSNVSDTAPTPTPTRTRNS